MLPVVDLESGTSEINCRKMNFIRFSFFLPSTVSEREWRYRLNLISAQIVSIANFSRFCYLSAVGFCVRLPKGQLSRRFKQSNSATFHSAFGALIAKKRPSEFRWNASMSLPALFLSLAHAAFVHLFRLRLECFAGWRRQCRSVLEN